MLTASLADVPDPIQEGNFINELKKDIRAEVRMAQPKGLGRIMNLAKRVEERNEILRKYKGENAPYGHQNIPGVTTNFRVQTPNMWSRSMPPTGKSLGSRYDPTFRCLTEAELFEK